MNYHWSSVMHIWAYFISFFAVKSWSIAKATEEEGSDFGREGRSIF